MTTPNSIQTSNELMRELNFGHQSNDRTVISTSPHIDNRKPGPLEQKTNHRGASDAPVPATQINIPSFLKPTEKLIEQDTLLDNSAGQPAYLLRAPDRAGGGRCMVLDGRISDYLGHVNEAI